MMRPKKCPPIRSNRARWAGLRNGSGFVRAFVLASAGLLALQCHSLAREPFSEFLKGLQNRGYGEQALAYLDQIGSRPDLPPEVRETLDFERSKSLRIAANEAGDRQQRIARLAEAKRFAEKFLSEFPAHPAGGSLLLTDADESLGRGEQSLEQAKGSQDKDVQKRAFGEANAAFSEAAGRFEVAIKRLKERLDALPPIEPGSEKPDSPAMKQRDELTLPWVEARSKLALSHYLLAQTFTSPENPEREKLLKQAGQEFEAVFTDFRRHQIGLLAHLWHGKTLDELGDALAAMEAFDDVLNVEPEDNADPALAPLFGQAQLFRLQLRAKSAAPSAVIKEGEQWRDAHKKWSSTSVYQGILLEVVRARLASIESLKANAEKTKALRECVAALQTIAKAESAYRQQALLLRRDVVGKMGSGAGLSAAETLALGDEAAADKNWPEATTFYEQALEQAGKSNDAKTGESAKTRIAQVLYRHAVDEYGLRNMEKALELCGKLVGHYPDNPLAEDASAVAIAAALAEYSEAPENAKQAAFGRLEKVTGFALNRWPNNSVADDARMALAQVALQANDYAKAEKQLAEVSRQSTRYPTALHVLGQVRWKQYLTAKNAAEGEKDAAEIQKLREEAITHLQTSLDRQKAAWQMTSEPMPGALFETQLLLGETYLEAKRWPEAAGLLSPLVDTLKTTNFAALGRSAQRAFVGAIRAWINNGEPASAAGAATFLIQASPDEELPNTLLVELAKLAAQESALRSAPTEPATELAPAPAADPLRELHLKLIDALVIRKALAIPQLMYLGDACSQLGLNDKARELYQKVLTAVDKDAAAKAAAGGAVAGIRARFARILRGEGKLEEAETQINALIKEHPKALEPLIEKGYIMQTLAERDPKRYDDCVAHWTTVRLGLGRMNPRPPEYYDVLYNAAYCLFRQAKATGDKKKAGMAEQLLKSPLTVTPALNGPETVKRYQTLLQQAAAIRGAPAPGEPPAAKRQ